MTAPVQASDVALAHHAAVEAFSSAAAQVADAMWAQVDPDNIVDSWARQLPELTAVVSGAQLGAARLADSYVDEAVEAQGLDAASVAAVNPQAFVGASDGGLLVSLLTNPAIVTLLTIQDVHDVARALSAGRSNLDMLVRTQVADAARAAEQVSITSHPAVDGYVRQTDGNPCARCLVLAGAFYRYHRGFRRHPRCGCVHVPARAGVQVQDPRSIYDRMSRAERLRAGFTLADMRALDEGADIVQVVNARHRPNALHTAGGRRLTREGATRRGVFGGYEILDDGRLRRRPREEPAARRPGERVRRVRRERLTTDEIFRQAGDDRDLAIRLLREHGYLLRRRVFPARPSGGAAPAGALEPVRRILQRAETVEDVSRVLAEEYQRITGRSVIVDLRGSVETAREHAEGVLRAVERNPQIDIVSVRTGPTFFEKVGVYAETDRRNIIFSEYWSAPERRQAYLEALAEDARTGWRAGGPSPVALAVHEAGHVLDPLTLARELDELLDDAARRMGVTRDRVVPANISGYAEMDRAELVAEAYADVVMNGGRASALSRDIVRLVESGGRGVPVPVAAVDLSRQPVTRLRAAVQGHGITVPAELDKAGLVRLVENLQSGMPPQQARAIAVQSVLDEKKVVADALVRAHELLGKEASDRALRWLASSIRRGGVGVNPNAPEFARLLRRMKPLLDALDAADEVAAKAAISAVARSMKLRQIGGEAGDVRAFARDEMSWIGQQRGEVAYVIRPGYAVQYDGQVRVLIRAEVMPATPEQIAASPPARRAKKAAKAAKAPAKKAPAPKAPPAPERMTAPALRRELSDRGVDLDMAGVPKSVLAEQVARVRAGTPAADVREALRGQLVERQRAAAQVLVEALSGGSAFRVRTAREAVEGWPMEAQVRSVVTAMRAGRGVERAVAAAERRLGLTRITDVEAGQRLVRPGYAVEVGGERVVLVRPEVEAIRGRDVGRPSRDVPSLREILESAPSEQQIARASSAMTLHEYEEFLARAGESLREGVEGAYGSLRVEVDRAIAVGPSRVGGRSTGGRLTVEGKVYDSKGREVGEFVRYIRVDSRTGDLVASHHFLHLERKVQGSGFAEEFNANLIEWYRRSGVKRIELHADIDVGGYAWAAKGYDFEDRQTAERFVGWASGKVAQALRRVERGGRPPRGLTEEQLRELGRYLDDLASGRRPTSAPEIARFGRREGQGGKSAVWPGKWLMLGSDWHGVLHL